MAKYTLFELHIDGAEFTANVPGAEATEDPEDTETDEAERGRLPFALLAIVALAVLAAAAIAAKRFTGDTDSSPLGDGMD